MLATSLQVTHGHNLIHQATFCTACKNLALYTWQSSAVGESRQCSKLLWHKRYHCKYELPQHCITPHKTTSELFRQTKAGRAIDGTKAGAEAFLGDHRHCRRLVGWKAGKHSPEQSITAELMHRQTDLHCAPGKCYLSPRAGPQTSDLLPGFCSPLGHGSCEETPPSLQVSYQGMFRPSQMFSSWHCTLPSMLLGKPAGCCV